MVAAIVEELTLDEVRDIYNHRMINDFPRNERKSLGIIEEGRAEGREEGRDEEHEKEMISGIRRAMDKQHLSLDDAMDYMDIPRVQWHKYALYFCEPEEAVKYQFD